LRVALETSMKVDARIVVCWCLDLSASIALALGNVREAARLVGAAERLREELGSIRGDDFEVVLFERTVESIRKSLGVDVSADEIQRGRELSLEEAVAYAVAATTGDLD
jgi:hypothetical protein